MLYLKKCIAEFIFYQRYRTTDALYRYDNVLVTRIPTYFYVSLFDLSRVDGTAIN